MSVVTICIKLYLIVLVFLNYIIDPIKILFINVYLSCTYGCFI